MVFFIEDQGTDHPSPPPDPESRQVSDWRQNQCCMYGSRQGTQENGSVEEKMGQVSYLEWKTSPLLPYQRDYVPQLLGYRIGFTKNLQKLFRRNKTDRGDGGQRIMDRQEGQESKEMTVESQWKLNQRSGTRFKIEYFTTKERTI